MTRLDLVKAIELLFDACGVSKVTVKAYFDNKQPLPSIVKELGYMCFLHSVPDRNIDEQTVAFYYVMSYGYDIYHKGYYKFDGE